MSGSQTSRKFHIIKHVATGGFGSVYLTKVVHGDGFTRVGALKLLHRKWSENEEVASRMRDEARLLGWLRHRNIVDVLDLTMIDGRVAVFMEYLDAVDIKVVIQACLHKGELLPVRVCLDICAAAASALDAAYNRPPYAGEKPLRVIHRDIKPSNIMVDESGLVKVLDFGVARAEFDTRETRTQEMAFGSLEYMPPERLFFEPETHHSDVYSLGATLFEMLATEKLGKAKLRPAAQEAFVDKRWDDLCEVYPMPDEEAGYELRQLLYDMLAFDGDERPSALDCVSRMRALARSIHNEPGLEEWAEGFLPPLIRAFQDRPSPGEDPLVDQVLAEDTQGFGAPDDTDPREIPEDAPIRQAEAAEEPVEHTPEDDRWEALKAATLAELGGSLPPARPREETPPPSAAEESRPPPPPRSSGELDLPPPQVTDEAPLPEAPVDTSPGWLAVIGMFLLGSTVLAAGIAAVAAVLVLLVPAAGPAVAAPAPEPAVAAVPPAPPAEEPIPTEPHALFRAVIDNPKRLTVACGPIKGDGLSRAAVMGGGEGEALGECRVTAVDRSRKRHIAKVEDVAIGQVWVCFQGGEKTCVQE